MAVSKNYDANAHEAQMKILHKLLMSAECQFSELAKACGLGSDHANFHIKKLLSSGLVERVPKSYGAYRLTRSGKEYANRMDTDEIEIEKQPKLSVVIVLVDGHGKKLCQERLKQPYYGYWTHPTGKIRWGEEVLEAAARELLEETGLTADLVVRGLEHRIDHDRDGALLEDKYFFIIDGSNPRGELVVDTDGVRNFWVDIDKYDRHDKKFDTANRSRHTHNRSDTVFMEHCFEFDAEEY